MARLRIDGMEDAINDLEDMAKDTSEVTDAMLQAGGDVVSDEWINSAEKHHHRDTGRMIASIKAAKKTKGYGSSSSIVVTAQGKDRKGVRNAEKAFILNYGTTKIAASHWIDEAERNAEPQVATTMQSIWDTFVATGTVTKSNAGRRTSGRSGRK